MDQSKRTARSRSAILEAAQALFRKQGMASTSMEDIAARAGLTRKTIYNLFPSKEDIGLRLVELAEARDEAYRGRMAAGEEAVALLTVVLNDSVAWCRANPSLALLALAPATRPTVNPPEGRPSFQRLVRDVLALGQKQGSVRSDEDVDFMALVLLGIYGQAMLSAIATSASEPPDIGRILAVLFNGIGQAAR